MALVLVSDRPRQFAVVPDGSGQGLVDHTTPATTPDPHAMYTTDAEASAIASSVASGAASGAISSHVGASDPHSASYYTKAVADQKYTDVLNQTGSYVTTQFNNHVAAADPHSTYAFDTDLSSHAAGTDPHPVYGLKTYNDGRYAPIARKTLGPYRATNGVVLASGGAGRTAASVVVPDPGFDWYAQAFGLIEVRVGATGTRAAAGIFRTDTNFANAISWGSGLDPVNQGTGGNGYWLIPVVPFGANDQMTNHKIAAGAAASARTFILSPCQDYGSANLDSTTFRISLVVWVHPA